MLESRDEIEQRRVMPAIRARQRAVELIERRARLQRRRCLDQIVDRSACMRIDPAVEETPEA